MGGGDSCCRIKFSFLLSGKWWSVKGEASKLISNIISLVFGVGLGTVLPLLQSIYICRYGTDTHAVICDVSDNRSSAWYEG